MKFTIAILATFIGLQATAALRYDRNVPANIKDQMEQDLAFAAQIQGTKQTPFHQAIFGQVSGTTYQQFFTTRIYEVGMSSCGGGAAVACVQPFFAPNKMWLTQNFVKFSHPQVARTMVVYHEARHTDAQNDNWPHDNCPTPFLDENGKDKVSIWTGAKLEGQPACDSTERGSYGSSTIMLKNIALFCDNCTDKVKMDADIYAQDQLGRINAPNVKAAMIKDFTQVAAGKAAELH